VRAQIESSLRKLEGTSTPLRSMEVIGDDPHSQELRKRLAGPHTRAAVLLGLIERPSGIHVLLTRRAAHLARHPGQVAFPGGRIEPADADATAAALREAYEEIGLEVAQVEIVGRLGDHVTGTGFVVTPIVGFIAPEFTATVDPAEVAAVFEVPLRHVLDPGLLRSCVQERYGARLRGYELIHDGERIWGATAAMLVAFRNILYES
jgi:8-oxo-dGTP pyrophosphatase MutT (NUDIX family)